MKRPPSSARLAFSALAGVFLLGWAWPQVEDWEEAGEEALAQDEAAIAAAMERMERDAEARGAGQTERARQKQLDSAAERAALRAIRVGPDSPLFRNGVPYLEDWEFRAGATKLLVPAYGDWVDMRRNRKVYQNFAQGGDAGDYLAAVLVNRGFIRRTGSDNLNFFGLVWVPQGEAFKIFSPQSFQPIKEGIKQQVLSARVAAGVDREDFDSFDDYINFKLGRDEKLESFVDQSMVLVSETPLDLMYFYTSLNTYETRSGMIREPMISTVAFALVQGKYLRFGFTRQFFDDEDIQGLVAFTIAFIEDMRRLNALPEDRRTGP